MTIGKPTLAVCAALIALQPTASKAGGMLGYMPQMPNSHAAYRGSARACANALTAVYANIATCVYARTDVPHAYPPISAAAYSPSVQQIPGPRLRSRRDHCPDTRISHGLVHLWQIDLPSGLRLRSATRRELKPEIFTTPRVQQTASSAPDASNWSPSLFGARLSQQWSDHHVFVSVKCWIPGSIRACGIRAGLGPSSPRQRQLQYSAITTQVSIQIPALLVENIGNQPISIALVATK